MCLACQRMERGTARMKRTQLAQGHSLGKRPVGICYVGGEEDAARPGSTRWRKRPAGRTAAEGSDRPGSWSQDGAVKEDATRPGSIHGNRLGGAAATWGMKKTQLGPGSFVAERLGKLRGKRPAIEDLIADRRVVKLRPVPQEPCRRREEPVSVQGALQPGCPRGRSEDAPTAANVSSGATIGRARLDPSGLTPGRLFGEQGSILCSRSRIRGTGILQVSRHETLGKPETALIITRTSDRMEGF